MRKSAWFVAAMLVAALLVPQAVLAAAGSFNSSSSAPAVAARNSGSGSGPAGRFIADGNGARAVTAEAIGDTGGTYGVYALSRAPTGRGIAGFNTSNTGTAIGASGQSSSFYGRGVNGLALSEIGYTQGGFFETKSRTPAAPGRFSAGVYGWASNPNATGTNYGVYGKSESSGGFGVFGQAEGSNATGVFGCGGWSGVEGNGDVYGVYGSTFVPNQVGVGGGSPSVTDRSFGVLSLTNLGLASHVIAEDNNNVAGVCVIMAATADRECFFNTENSPGVPVGRHAGRRRDPHR
jgi:hypothetical protein